MFFSECNSDGTFKAGIGSGSLYGASRSSLVDDLNGDGKADLIAGGNGGFAVQFGVGDGTFGSTQGYTITGSGGSSASSYGFKDLNSDGILDVSLHTSGGIIVRLGVGDGTFGAEITSPDSYNAIDKIVVGDFNNDGVKDIVSASNSDSSMHLLLAKTQASATAINVDISTQAAALDALTSLNSRLTSLASRRGSIGAFQSRIGSALSNLQNATVEIRAAASRIRDVDMAAEVASYTRLKILQQVGAAVLAQANQEPDIALTLLR